MKVKHDSALLEYLFETLGRQQSRTSIRNLLSSGRIMVNGTVRTAFDFGLKEGDEVRIAERGNINAVTSVDDRLKVLYEDRWLLVVEKGCGLPTISTGRENEKTAYSILTDYVRRRNRSSRVFIVHRLDRDTSGLLVFAKDEETKLLMQENWNDCVRERKYTAVSEGNFDRQEGRIVSWLKENPKSLKMSCSSEDNGGKRAVTYYKVLRQGRNHAMLEVELETGRKNQIRVQLSYIGHPISGDRKYDASGNLFGRLALHASALSFIHPHTGKLLEFKSMPDFTI